MLDVQGIRATVRNRSKAFCRSMAARVAHSASRAVGVLYVAPPEPRLSFGPAHCRTARACSYVGSEIRPLRVGASTQTTRRTRLRFACNPRLAGKSYAPIAIRCRGIRRSCDVVHRFHAGHRRAGRIDLRCIAGRPTRGRARRRPTRLDIRAMAAHQSSAIRITCRRPTRAATTMASKDDKTTKREQERVCRIARRCSASIVADAASMARKRGGESKASSRQVSVSSRHAPRAGARTDHITGARLGNCWRTPTCSDAAFEGSSAFFALRRGSFSAFFRALRLAEFVHGDRLAHPSNVTR